jgi:hypothetical protein
MEVDTSIFRVATLKIDSIISSETLVPINRTTRCHILNESNTGDIYLVVWNVTSYSLAVGYKYVLFSRWSSDAIGQKITV